MATEREWGDVVSSDATNGATIETESGKTGTVVAVRRPIVKFRAAGGALDAAHISRTRVVAGARANARGLESVVPAEVVPSARVSAPALMAEGSSSTQPSAVEAANAEPTETSVASSGRWGGVTRAAVGGLIETRDGRRGQVLDVGRNVVSFRLADGRVSATRIGQTRIAQPQLASPNSTSYEKTYEAKQAPAHSGGTARVASGSPAGTAGYAGEPGEEGRTFAPTAGSLDTLGRFIRGDHGVQAHLARLGIVQKRVSVAEARGGMAMTEEGILLWSDEGVLTRLLSSPPALRQASLFTLALEEMIHRAHHLVEPFSGTFAARRWERMPEPLQRLVNGAYRSTFDPRLLGMEYVRMLVQVRSGFPLSEEFYRDVVKLREALALPQPPGVERLIAQVSRMLFSGRAPQGRRRAASGDPSDTLFAEPADFSRSAGEVRMLRSGRESALRTLPESGGESTGAAVDVSDLGHRAPGSSGPSAESSANEPSEAATELATQEQELVALPAGTAPFQRDLLKHRIQALRENISESGGTMPRTGTAGTTARGDSSARPAPTNINAGTSSEANTDQTPQRAASEPPVPNSPTQSAPAASPAPSPVPASRTWGDIRAGDVGQWLMDRSGRVGKIYQLNARAVAARGEDGKAFGVRRGEAMLMPPAGQPATALSAPGPVSEPALLNDVENPAGGLDQTGDGFADHAGEPNLGPLPQSAEEAIDALEQNAAFHDAQIAEINVKLGNPRVKYPEKKALFLQKKRLAIDCTKRARELVSVPVKERGTVTVKSIVPDVLKEAVENGLKLVSRYANAKLLPIVYLQKIPAEERAEYCGEVIFVPENTSAIDVAHETTHALELQNTEVVAAAEAFLKQRTFGEKPKSLSVLTGDSRYEADEWALEDHWKKLGGEHYCGKIYPTGTELLTLGMRRLNQDPLRFAREDPEYFSFVVKMLRQW